MKIGVILEDNSGTQGHVCSHFGQCQFFLLADINQAEKKITNTQVVPNSVVHGGGGCHAVDELLKYNITHVIAGGMGMGAQAKFEQAGVQVFGYTGKVQDAINALMNNALGGLEACREHGDSCH